MASLHVDGISPSKLKWQRNKLIPQLIRVVLYGFLPQHGITAYQLSNFCLIINIDFTQGKD